MATDSFINIKTTMEYSGGAGSDDEDSFVVLETTPPNEEAPESVEEVLAPLRTNKIHEMQNLLKLSIAQIEQIPEMPSAVNPLDAVASSITRLTISPDSSYEEIQKQVEELIKENETLKNIIAQNNMSMKSQYEKFSAYRDEVTNVMKSYKDKFNEAKICVSKFKEKNEQLHSELDVYVNLKKLHEEEIITLKEQIRNLKTAVEASAKETLSDHELAAELSNAKLQINELQLQNQTINDLLGKNLEDCKIQLVEANTTIANLIEEKAILKTATDNARKLSEQLTVKDKEIEKLTQKLVAVHKNEVLTTEDNNIQKLKSQLSQKEQEIEKLTEKLVNTPKLEDQLQTKQQEINVLQFDISTNKSETAKLKCENNQLRTQLHNLTQEKSNLNEMEENLKSKIAEIALLNQSLHRSQTTHTTQQEEISLLKKKLKNMKDNYDANLQEELIQIRRQLCEAQQTITALETERATKGAEIEKLRKIIQEAQAKNDEIFALQEQLDVYKNDFEAEKESKTVMKREKDQLAEDLKNVQNRNKQLQNEIETLRARNQPKAEGYSCPKCSFAFSSYQSLENHVHRCLDLDGLP